MRRRRSVLSVAGLGLCATLGIAGSALLAAGPAAATKVATAKPVKITVTASEFKFKLSRTSVPAGTTVIFTVKNVGKIGHNFKINGKITKLIAAGKSATLTVKFAKKGKFAYLCTIPGHAAGGMKGTFGVGVAAPISTNPTTTAPTTFPGPGGTVQVSMFEYGFTFTPAVIPSGNVTFVMADTGSVTHNLDIQGVVGGIGPFANPGQTVSMTVNLQAGHTYGFLCDVPGHADQGMQGSFVPTP
jgi:nitrite reductase (NO-forming)